MRDIAVLEKVLEKADEQQQSIEKDNSGKDALKALGVGLFVISSIIYLVYSIDTIPGECLATETVAKILDCDKNSYCQGETTEGGRRSMWNPTPNKPTCVLREPSTLTFNW